MRPAWGAMIALCLASFALATLPAHAQEPKRTFPNAQDCMASGDAFNHPSCTSSENGVWVADYGGSQGGGAAGAGFGAFIVIALLWAAAPAVIAGVVASSRGTSVGLSVLLGLVLGWIGLIIVVVAFKPEVKQAAEAVIRNASTTSPPAPARHDVAARLTQLDELKQRGLLSDDEYRNRRQVILDEI